MVELPLVQILVKVANTQVGPLRANVGKGFMTMEVSHELVDPKVMVNSTQNEYPSSDLVYPQGELPFHWTCYRVSVNRKGMR